MDIESTKVAFVDDGEMMLDLADVILKNAGFTNITLFNSGTKFLKHYEDKKKEVPDIVFLDIKLESHDIDGVEVLKRARRNEKFSKTIFVSLSSYFKNIDKEWLEYSGFDDVLFKPIDEKKLLNKINLLIEMKDDITGARKSTQAPEILINKFIRAHIRSKVLEKDYIKKLISPEVFDMLESNPEKLIPTEQDIAVGFLDIRGFTKINNIVNDAKKMSEIFGIFFDFVCEHISNRKGFLDKFIGDAVMWFHKDDLIERISKQCIDVAVDIIKRIDMINEVIRNEMHIEIPIKVGIGIACGRATVGLFGAPNYRIQYSVFGSPVNFASFFCSKAKKNEIIIGDTIINYCPYQTEGRGFFKDKLPYKTELRKIIIPERTNEA